MLSPAGVLPTGRSKASCSSHSTAPNPPSSRASLSLVLTVELGRDGGSMVAAVFLGQENGVLVIVGVHHVGLHGHVPFCTRPQAPGVRGFCTWRPAAILHHVPPPPGRRPSWELSCQLTAFSPSLATGPPPPPCIRSPMTPSIDLSKSTLPLLLPAFPPLLLPQFIHPLTYLHHNTFTYQSLIHLLIYLSVPPSLPPSNLCRNS